eukprot:CAMPEP_0198653796 /NCGR_PEP_ID=MMETSP1467-20131203/7290_1 /TAXON_ID=1462469 /ORGANISM="unid. sp., Strain CCMP2135" /LENGTH=84 /DNA_ID=CAMNT_0044389769 /DNA_START=52 /DNA_END=302 /DNA_ORIENTATION=+
MAADVVATWRADIRRTTNEALSCNGTEKVSKRSRLVELWAAVVSETTDKEQLALAEKQLALAEKQLYYAHLARLELVGVAEAQR